MLLKSCNIIFDNGSKGVFYTGDSVSGVIILNLKKTEKFTDLLFQSKGVTHCGWTVSRTRSSTRYVGHKEHFRYSTSLFADNPRTDGLVVLGPGSHCFKFYFDLPLACPSSFQGSFGRIVYSIKITSKMPLTLDKKMKIPLSVITRYDLNENENTRMPLKLEFSKDYMFLFCTRGRLNMTIEMPCRGYVPAQEINLKCILNNNSYVSIQRMKVVLKKHITFTCTRPYEMHRHEELKLSTYIGRGPHRGERMVVPVVLKIPLTSPTSTKDCLIAIRYFMKVKVVASGLHGNIKKYIPVAIGTVPLTNPLNDQINEGPPVPPHAF